MDSIPPGLQTFSHSFADQGCYIFAMCGIALQSLSASKDPTPAFYPAMDPLGAAYHGVRMKIVSDDKLMKVLDYPKFMEYLTTTKPKTFRSSETLKWGHRKEVPGYSAIEGEFLIGRYSGIIRVNPIKHYVRLMPDGKTIHVDSMVKSPITKKGDLTSIHVFWRKFE